MTIAPGSEEWARYITPSKVPAILGISRWGSPYQLWHRMKGLVEPEPHKEIFDIGHDYEPAAANRWLRQNPGWSLSPGEVQLFTDRLPFPALCTLDRRASRGRARMVVEFKTTRNMGEWGDNFSSDCPQEYAAQVLMQMLISGYTDHPGNLLVLGPWFTDHTYHIPWDQDVADWMVEKCAAFYRSLQSDEPPPLDSSEPTYECVRQINRDVTDDSVQIDEDLAFEVHDADEALKEAVIRRRSAKTQLLAKMRGSSRAMLGDTLVAVRRRYGDGGMRLCLARTHPRDAPTGGAQ